MNCLALASLIIVAVVAALLLIFHVVPPAALKTILSTLVIIALSCIGVAIIGPVKIFYQLHEMIFPGHHQWFFIMKIH